MIVVAACSPTHAVNVITKSRNTNLNPIARPAIPSDFFLSQCSVCSDAAVSQHCSQISDTCRETHYDALVERASPPIGKQAAIAECTRPQIFKTQFSIYCDGIQLVQSCQLAERCLLMDKESVIIMGTTIAILHELQQALKESENVSDVIFSLPVSDNTQRGLRNQGSVYWHRTLQAKKDTAKYTVRQSQAKVPYRNPEELNILYQ